MNTDATTASIDQATSQGETQDVHDPASTTKIKRTYTRKSSAQRALDEARRVLDRAIEMERKAIAEVQAEERAALVRSGRQDFIVAVEKLDSTTREAIFAAVLETVDAQKQSHIHAWGTSLED